jgi:hypothetical protein
LAIGREAAVGGETTNDQKLPPHDGAHPDCACSFVVARRSL